MAGSVSDIRPPRARSPDAMGQSFVLNAWHVAAWDFELRNDRPLARRILGEDVVLYRGDDGVPVALVDRCCHRLAPLSRGRIEGSRLRCMYHGLLYDPSGRCVEVPQQRTVPRALRVQSFPVVERDRYVWIWMGDDEPDKDVHDAHWQSDPAWRSIPKYAHFEAANYLLIMDNLLDFSHLGFVHEGTLGGGRSGEIKPVVERQDWGVRITRRYLNDEIPPYLRDIAKFTGPADRWQIYEYHAAGNFLSMDSGCAPAGSRSAAGQAGEGACVFHSVQSLTPESERSTHYFWTFAHNFDLGNDALTAELANRVSHAFTEDKAMIQAQQRVMSDHPDAQMTGLASDAALHHLRQLIARSIERERNPTAEPARPQPASRE